MTQICVIPQKVAASDFELTQKCVIPHQKVAVSDFELTQKCVMENPRLQLEGGLDTNLCHQRIRECNLQQLAAASLNSMEEDMATIYFSRAAPLHVTTLA